MQESRFHQMLGKLLKNAMESTDELPNGPAERAGGSLAWPYRAEGALVIDVIDNGVGIEALQFHGMLNAGYTTTANGRGLTCTPLRTASSRPAGTSSRSARGSGHDATMRVTLRARRARRFTGRRLT